MSKDLSTNKGTIAYTLNENKEAIFKLIEQGKVYEAKVTILKALDDDESLVNNPQKNVCKAQLLKAKNQNHFLSTYCTYLTGLKVS